MTDYDLTDAPRPHWFGLSGIGAIAALVIMNRLEDMDSMSDHETEEHGHDGKALTYDEIYDIVANNAWALRLDEFDVDQINANLLQFWQDMCMDDWVTVRKAKREKKS